MYRYLGRTGKLRRLISVVATITALVSIQLLAASPAYAAHSVTITHAPPPVGVAGADVQLVVAVDGCWIFCSPISLETTYRTAEGRTRTMHQSLGSFGPQVALVVIPGRHVTKPALAYFLQAKQDYCWFDACHEADTRLPETGSYSVPIP
ncbi:MAG TPA: hypothetical protein VHJ82_01455 [Actinomycetota bacterium]|nr:hypothetical protein [Actinomycetota bacterium]